MKKFWLSPFAKAAAVIAFILAAATAGFCLSQVIVLTNEYDIFALETEDDYMFARSMNIELRKVMYSISNGTDYLPQSKNIRYRISIPQRGIDEGVADLAFDSETMYGAELVSDGNDCRYSSNIDVYYDRSDGIPECSVVMVYTDEYVKNYTAGLANAQKQVYRMIYCSAGAIIVLLLMFIYLACVCGRRQEDNEVHLLLADRVWPELQLALGGGVFAGAAALALFAMDACYSADKASQLMLFNFRLAAAAGAAVCATATMTVLLSWLRLAKNRTFVKSCLCVLLARVLIRAIKGITVWVFKTAGKILSWIHRFFRKILLGLHAFADVLIAYKAAKTAAFASCGLALCMYMLGVFSGFKTFVAGAVLVAFVLSRLGRIIKSHENIAAGIKAMRAGNVDYRITQPEDAYFSELAEAVNGIGDGMRAATERRVKAERMKTELITNVSHDLKTPLTSIISYSDLLCDMQLSPPEANDYAAIIRKKGERLKNLTQDLFDISKAQSGNEQVNREKIDISLLISQALGESDCVIEKAGLVPVVKLEKELYITADGKKMSRVIENLIGNIEKYAQKGTRVFVTAKQEAGTVFAEFKNTSAAPLDFDTTEICDRFVRGDSSRSEEGSGLGLAIAKSYTELCGGSFKIETDGDLFKAQITFAPCGEN